MPQKLTHRWFDRYNTSIRHELRTERLSDTPTERLMRIHDLSLTAGKLIELEWGFDLPDPRVSAALLDIVADEIPAIAWLQEKITLDDEGHWRLPLAAEYDDKNRARYPQVSNVRFNAHSELSHRFVVKRMLNVALAREQHIDHQCRRHDCCNPSHLMVVTPGQNLHRSHIAARSATGQVRLIK